jgi:hypothetical protein
MSSNLIRVGVGVGGVAVAAAGAPAVIVAVGATAAVSLVGYAVYSLIEGESRPAAARPRLPGKAR